MFHQIDKQKVDLVCYGRTSVDYCWIVVIRLNISSNNIFKELSKIDLVSTNARTPNMAIPHNVIIHLSNKSHNTQSQAVPTATGRRSNLVQFLQFPNPLFSRTMVHQSDKGDFTGCVCLDLCQATF